MRKLLYIVCITIGLLCSCHRDPVWQTLNEAESIMEEHPDSALALLTAIEDRTFKGETQARYALLLSQAYDKNYIDVTNDSIISIAVNYYNATNDLKNQMLANYYWTVVHMNQQDYDGALSEALNVEKLASQLEDTNYLARTKLLIARAYLFSYNLEGAEEYFSHSLRLSQNLNKLDWIGIIFYNLANLELYKQNYSQCLTYIDSVKKYMDSDEDIIALEIFAHIGLGQYDKADSIYTLYDIVREAPQLQAYHTLSKYRLGLESSPSYEQLFSNCTSHYDSLDIAFVANQIAQEKGDFQNAWQYTELLRQESNKVLSEISTHSLYRTKIEHDKTEHLKIQMKLKNEERTTTFIIIIALFVCIILSIYLRLIKKDHKAKALESKQHILLISAELSNLKHQHKQERERFNAIQSVDASTIHSLQEQIQAANLAAQSLFMDKYSWIEELGNIYLDAEISKSSSNRAMRELKKRLDTVKNTQFIPQLTDVINKYRNNLITRITTNCPSISESEKNIIVLLCANLSTRIIAYLLDIKHQSIYNAKSTIKKKLESSCPELIQEMSDIFHTTV